MNKLLIIFIAALFCTGIAAAQDTLYSETVENGSLENIWYPGFNGNNMDVEFMPGNPSGDSWVGKLGNDISGGGVGQSFSGDMTWTDFYLEAQVYIPVNEGTYYGIEFRVDSVGLSSGYQFVARFKPGGAVTPRLRFRVRPPNDPAIPVVIRDWVDTEIPGGIPTTSGWHLLAVEATGNQFRFFFDGNELPGGPVTDNTFSSGWIGSYVWDFMLSPIYLFIDDIYVVGTSTGIEDPQAEVLSGYTLHQNYPNPFNPNTAVRFELGNRELVQLGIYNNLGQRVNLLVNNELPAGSHQVQWDGLDDTGKEVPAGVYYYRIRAGSFHATNKMLLIK